MEHVCRRPHPFSAYLNGHEAVGLSGAGGGGGADDHAGQVGDNQPLSNKLANCLNIAALH